VCREQGKGTCLSPGGDAPDNRSLGRDRPAVDEPARGDTPGVEAEEAEVSPLSQAGVDPCTESSSPGTATGKVRYLRGRGGATR
jgi:hypothetical protein